MFSLEVALPSSVVSIENGLLLRTLKIYQIIRTTAIFGVEKIIVYHDGFIPLSLHRRVTTLIKKIHKYLLTPPYLRRKLVPIDKDLRFVGALPPLRLNVFDVSSTPRLNEIRICLIRRTGGKVLADCGLKKEVLIVDSVCDTIGDRLGIVKIIDTRKMIGRCIDRNKHKIYLGPSLSYEHRLKDIVDKNLDEDTCIVGTSRYGSVPAPSDVKTAVSGKNRLLVLFGSPYGGLYEIARNENWDLSDKIKYVWNTIPGQHVKTIRTEEALIITLGLINLLIRK